MGRNGSRQGTPAGHHVAEIHQRRIGHAEGDIQIPQAHVGVDAEHLPPLQGQSGSEPPRERGFSRAAFPGCDDDNAAHNHSS